MSEQTTGAVRNGAGAAPSEVEALRARAARERKARLEAEAIAETATADLYGRQLDLELLKAVAVGSNAAHDVRSALQAAVDAICARTGWPVGHVFLLSQDGQTLLPTRVWHLTEPERFGSFKRVTENSSFTAGVGLPGRTLEASEPVWIEDVDRDDNFPRGREAGVTGVNAAFAFPILIEAEVVGVVEFFSPRVAEPDERLLELAMSVGVQLGRVIERDRAQREIRRRSDELQRYADELEYANDELKEFAYVASHDLSEPLRTITGFVQLLSQRYRGQLDDTADEFIDFVVDGTERMQGLIDGLLSYSRAGRADLVRARVDLNEVAARSRETLTASIAEADAELQVGRLPVVAGDAGQLDRLFENLISNAVKFRGDRRPVIRIEAEMKSGGWWLAVADNGIGIEERHRERIFNVFQRLHGPTEYPGTGIGLSICKKVVERHGGRLWVEETEGGGSTFRFVLPDHRDAVSE